MTHKCLTLNKEGLLPKVGVSLRLLYSYALHCSAQKSAHNNVIMMQGHIVRLFQPAKIIICFQLCNIIV